MTDPTKPMGPPPRNMPSDKPADNMRDARLAKALQHMPDAHMQPSAQTRSAVLQEAARAVGAPAQPTLTPMPQRQWWHAWLGQPDQRVPWGAAVASLAVFGFITVMWYGQEVPDAAPERSAVVAHKADVGAEVKAEAQATGQADATAKPSAEKRVEAVAPQARTPDAARVIAPAAAPVAPPMADAVAEASPPAAPVVAPATANTAMEADAPAPQARLERRSKAMQSEEATADRLQARESGALAPRVAAAPPAPPPPAAAVAVESTAAAGVVAAAGPAGVAKSAVATMAATPAKARSDATAPAAAPAVWVLTLGDVKRSIRPEQAQKLLAQLRALPYAAVTQPPQPADGSGDAIRLESAGQERWVIAPGHVTYERSGASGAVSAEGSAPQRSPITPAQYAALRRLAMELGAEPSYPLAP